MNGMTAARKVKVSVTLSKDLVELIDREATGAANRSAVVELWLRRAARTKMVRDIERATEDYYDSLSVAERTEEESLGRSLSRAARKIRYDDERPTRRTKRIFKK
jgi:metal-responsive CopG/Arc/MetJ family transcriptional regulator